jgi:L-iditol 2-dehydrogenase
MKVLRLHAAGDLRLHDEPVCEPAEGEALLRLTAVGVCGSDLHWFGESGIGDARLEHPLVLGHEFAALRVEDARRVAVDPAIPCGSCELCSQGHPNLCPQVRFAGHGRVDGALREYMPWPAALLHPLPEALSDADGAMLEPLGVALHAVDLGHLRLGMRVGVFGCGPIGLLIIQLVRLAGAVQIIATDPLAHRLDAARFCGATHLIQASLGAEAPEVWEAAAHRGVDVAFEVAGENAAVETAIHAAKPGGQVVLVGIPADNRTSFNAATARRKGLTLRLCRRMKHTYPRAIALVEQGLVDVRSLLTHRFPLERYRQAFETASRREGIKVILEI